ncbi:winged helix-turn-helix transcriptional regulator [Streptomyces sp. NPDC058733]|uniref:winged helix-turn-helix transcriptional regulator n=1 Tax=Streptomyces sp. NPDC058733 TaxID=3346614 RepID=UPI0036770AF6
MAAMDLFGRRWALRILWELRAGPLGARALPARCEGLSSSVLYQRLRELASSGIIASSADGYELTRTRWCGRRACGRSTRWSVSTPLRCNSCTAADHCLGRTASEDTGRSR